MAYAQSIRIDTLFIRAEDGDSMFLEMLLSTYESKLCYNQGQYCHLHHHENLKSDI